MNLTP